MGWVQPGNPDICGSVPASVTLQTASGLGTAILPGCTCAQIPCPWHQQG